MTKSRQRKLKVFQAQFGFFDTVVAAPSQAAALRAWGIHQNLFANGEAKATDDKASISAALQHPETPLRRAIGTSDPFQLEPANLPIVQEASKRPAVKSAVQAKPKPLPKPYADRSALDRAEAALRQLDEARKREEEDLRQQQTALDVMMAKTQAAYFEAREKVVAALGVAQNAYRAAGGRD